jgi:hypothetical protein
LVLMVRLWNQERREEWELSQKDALDMERQYEKEKDE